MKSIVFATLAGAFALATSQAKEVGQTAPAFTAPNLKGTPVSLADHKGKVVALEWINLDCPFVKKHYGSGNMQKLQADAAAKGVVWLTVNSSAQGKQGYNEPSKMSELISAQKGKAADVLMDTDGTVGKAYDAKVTPHMMIIDKEGKLAYSGAIDSMATPEQADVEKADKLFATALEAVIAGKPVSNATNKPYGCSVKY